jgi:signal transduction histidine kinase
VTVVDRIIDNYRRIPPILADAGLAAGILGVATIELTFNSYSSSQLPEALVLLAIGILGVTLRRTSLWAGYAMVVSAAFVGLAMDNIYPGSLWGAYLSQLVLLYSVSEGSVVMASIVAVVAQLVIDFAALHPAGYSFPVLLLADYPFVTLVWFAGRAQRRRRALASDLGRSIEMLHEERGRLARSALMTERWRIAGELHGLVVRGVERMNEEASAARRHLASDPTRASESIGTIEQGGRGTLIEMRRLLTVLRTQSAAEPHLDNTKLAVPWQARAPADSPGAVVAQTRSLAGEARFVGWGTGLLAVPWVVDALVMLAVAGVALAETFWEEQDFRIHVVLAAIVVGALLFRRLAPLAVLCVIGSAILLWNLSQTGQPRSGDLAIIVAVFTLAVLRGPWWGVIGIGIEVVAYAPLMHSGTCDVPCQVGWTSLFVFAVIAGVAVREVRRLNLELAEQTDMLRRTREELVRRTVGQERSRISRDIHDMVAHGVTLMVIQAGVARWLAEANPARAEQALRAVEKAGNDALLELRSLVEALASQPSDRADPIPARDQLRIGPLVEHAVEAGMQVELVIRGEPRPLDPGLELSLYRIIQEALTNVRRHAPGAKACVELRYVHGGVEAEVSNVAGRTALWGSPAPGTGQGLLGMAERAALFGGTVEAGPTPNGGFRVLATLAEEQVLA